MADLGLKRVLGLPTTVFIAVGGTIGGGVFLFTGIVLDIAGSGLPIAYTLAVLPVFVSMMPLAMLGSALPTVGGSYRYPSRMVSPGIAFTGIWVFALASFFGQIPLYALGCARYAQAIFPGLPPVPAAVGLITLFVVINYFGIRIAAQIQGVLVVTLIAALLHYSFAGLQAIDPSRFTDMFAAGAANLLLGTALLTFTYFGANAIIELGGEIITPGKTIPRAFFIAFPLVTVVYVAVAVATVGALPVEELKMAAEPLIRVGEVTCSRGGLLFFIIGGAIFALTTTLNALFIIGTKSLMMIVQDGLLPAAFGRVHPRYGTPHVLLLTVWVLSAAGILSGFSLKTFASYAALGGLIVFVPTLLAAIRFPRLYPERYAAAEFKLGIFWLWFCSLCGITMVLFFGAVILADLESLMDVGCFGLFVASGVIYYRARTWHLRRQGIDPATPQRNPGDWHD